MKKLDDYVRGWLVGDFEPSLIRSKDIEVGFRYYEKDDYEEDHVHQIITEYTIVIDGEILMNDVVYVKGDIVKIEPGEWCSFKSLTDSSTLVIKTPSITSDKYVREI